MAGAEKGKKSSGASGKKSSGASSKRPSGGSGKKQSGASRESSTGRFSEKGSQNKAGHVTISQPTGPKQRPKPKPPSSDKK